MNIEDCSFLTGALGVFFGAFFAFIFGLTAYLMQKKFDRYREHKRAVVELEHLLQEHLDRSSANQFLLDGAIKTIGNSGFSLSSLNDLRLPEDLTLRLGELALINRYVNYQASVLRMNHSIQTWQRANQMLYEATIPEALTSQAEKANRQHIVDLTSILLKFLQGLDEDMEYLVSYVRVFLKKDKYIWSIPWLKRGKIVEDDVVSDKEVKNELSKMKGKIDKVKWESKERIKKILAKKIQLNN